MGNPQMMTQEARVKLAECEIILAFGRIGELFEQEFPHIQVCSYGQLFEQLSKNQGNNVAVLVSGDVGFFSLAKTIERKCALEYRIETVCGINSMQYLSSKLHMSYEDISIFSLHGRNEIYQLLGFVSYKPKIFVLTGGKNTVSSIFSYLEGKIPDDIVITVGENLSMKEERITTGNISQLKDQSFSDLAVLFIQNPNHVKENKHYRDEDFTRTKTPMSKRAIRNLAVDYLDIQKDDVVFDIGGGTGSVSVELASHACEGVVYSIEKKKDAFETLVQNKEKFRSFNLIPVFGNGKEMIDELPIPTKVFIGGSTGELPEMVKKLLERNNEIQFLISAITLETLTEAMTCVKELELAYEVTTINSAYNRQAGNYNLMTAHNPVTFIHCWRSVSLD